MKGGLEKMLRKQLSPMPLMAPQHSELSWTCKLKKEPRISLAQPSMPRIDIQHCVILPGSRKSGDTKNFPSSKGEDTATAIAVERTTRTRNRLELAIAVPDMAVLQETVIGSA